MPRTYLAAWNASPTAGVDAYRFYWGHSPGQYTAPGSPKNMGNALDGTFDVAQDGNVYCAVTALIGASESLFGPVSTIELLSWVPRSSVLRKT